MSQSGWILVVEDNPIRRKQLASGLEERGAFQVCTAGTVAQATILLNGSGARFDAIVLDDQLPDGTGRNMCAEMRGRGNWTPLIMISNRATEADVVRSFEAGADDHVVRPSVSELVARLRVQLRGGNGYIPGGWRTRNDSNVRPLPSEGSALSS